MNIVFSPLFDMMLSNPPNKSKNFLRAESTPFTTSVFSLAPKSIWTRGKHSINTWWTELKTAY